MFFHFKIGDKMSPAAVHVFRMAGHVTRAIVEGEADDAANGQGPRIGKIWSKKWMKQISSNYPPDVMFLQKKTHWISSAFWFWATLTYL